MKSKRQNNNNIGFFVVCFQIFSLESGIGPYFYQSGIFSCDHEFGLIVLIVINQIMTYQINQLYLVVHYVESHVLGRQRRVKAELILSTSIVA